MALGPVIPYSKISQLSINGNPSGRYVLNSHMITMPFSGPEDISRVSATILPRPVEQVKQLFRV